MSPLTTRKGAFLGILPAALLLAPLPATADEAPPATTSPATVRLALPHEPIQPLPPPTASDRRKVSLGERLFREPRLSRNNDMACINCHILEDNGADRLARSIGREGIRLDVNTPTVFNSSLNPYQFWDGRAQSLEQQIDFVVTSDKEFATRWPAIIAKLEQDAGYRNAFNRLYPDGITAANIRDAIAAFERTLITTNSRFDRFLLGAANAITPEEKRGYHLFKAYGCVACHQGSNVGGNLFMRFGLFGDYFAKRGNPTPADLGRFNVTGRPDDRHLFRVPSLRLAALTPPYFHDGSVNTLEEAVKIMAKHLLGRMIPEPDIHHIVAFLKSLPGEYRGQPLGRPAAAPKTSGTPR